MRVSEIEKVRIIVEEELEAAWSGKTPAKQALDTAVSAAMWSCRQRGTGEGSGESAREEVIRPRLGWPLPRVFAHRCGGALAPENTLAGLRIAARLGLRAVEFDVMLSADRSPWLMHDETLEPHDRRRGRVCETGDALAPLDAGAAGTRCRFCRRAAADAGVGSARLSQLGLRANVEIKPAAGSPR
jgi:hypothetical protein